MNGPNEAWDCDEVMQYCATMGYQCECASTGQGTTMMRYREGYNCITSGFWCGAIMIPPGGMAEVSPEDRLQFLVTREEDAGKFAALLREQLSPNAFSEVVQSIDAQAGDLPDVDRVLLTRRLYAQAFASTYLTRDGWVTNGAMAIREPLVDDRGFFLGEHDGEIASLLGACPVAYHVTPACLAIVRRFDAILIVSDDGDAALIDRVYAKMLHDVPTLYGTSDPHSWLQDAPAPSDANVIVAPIKQNILIATAKDIQNIRRAAQGLQSVVQRLREDLW
jgi:hypothetical protein